MHRTTSLTRNPTLPDLVTRRVGHSKNAGSSAPPICNARKPTEGAAVPNTLELLRGSTWEPFDGLWSLIEQPDRKHGSEHRAWRSDARWPPWRLLRLGRRADLVVEEGAPAHLDFLVAGTSSSLSPSDRDARLAEYGADGWLYVLMTGSGELVLSRRCNANVRRHPDRFSGARSDSGPRSMRPTLSA